MLHQVRGRLLPTFIVPNHFKASTEKNKLAELEGGEEESKSEDDDSEDDDFPQFEG
jgi:hypothetical protein